MIVFNAQKTRAYLNFASLIEALKQRFAAKGCLPARHVHALEEAATLLIMPAWDKRLLGIKTVTVFPNNGSSFGLPSVQATYQLFDSTSGKPLAILDGGEITSRRTVAVSALACAYLSRQDAKQLLVVGAGQVAALIPEAMLCIRPEIKQVVVWNRDVKKAHVLAALWQKQGIDARAIVDLEAAARNADIISCATLAKDPLIRRSWLKPGAHLDLIGSFTPQMSEAEPACFRNVRFYCDSEEALVKSGDLLNAIASGDLDPHTGLNGTLSDLCANLSNGREKDEDITVFKSVGTSLADLAAASLVWQFSGVDQSENS